MKWKSLFRRLVEQQQSWCLKFDELLPAKFRLHGNSDFLDDLVPRYVQPGSVVFDVGGGKHPYFSPEEKISKQLTVIGIDIDERELRAAPQGAYDRVVAADIQQYRGNAEADYVICQALLEHVPRTELAFQSVASILKPGGLALIFAPSRNSIFARLNLVLPERVKRFLLFTFFPVAENKQGFPSYYNRCTPAKFRELARHNGLEVVEERLYFVSSYFSICFPVYLLWRAWTVLGSFLSPEKTAETFCMVLKRVRGQVD